NADLATHAYGNVNVELLRIELRLTGVNAGIVRLLIGALGNGNALRRTLDLANLAGHAAKPSLPILCVIYKERKHARRFGLGQALFRKLHRSQPLPAGVAAKEIPGRLRQTLNDAFTQHKLPFNPR